MSYEASVTIQANFARKGYDVIYKPSNTSFFISYELLTNVTDAEWHHAIYGGPNTLHMLLWEKRKSLADKLLKSRKPALVLVDLGEGMLVPKKFVEEVILAESDYDAKYPSMDDLKSVLDLLPKP